MTLCCSSGLRAAFLYGVARLRSLWNYCSRFLQSDARRLRLRRVSQRQLAIISKQLGRRAILAFLRTDDSLCKRMKPRFADESYGDQNREAKWAIFCPLTKIDISWLLTREARERLH